MPFTVHFYSKTGTEMALINRFFKQTILGDTRWTFNVKVFKYDFIFNMKNKL